MPVRILDYSALTEPVSRADIAAWRTQARASGAQWASNASSIGAIIVAAVVGLFVIFMLGGVLASFLTEGIRNGNAIGIVFPGVFVAVFVAIAIGPLRARFAHGGRWEKWFRLDRFAGANQMTFRPMDIAPAYPGEIFHLGRNGVVVEHLMAGGGTADSHFLDLANYRYITGSGKSQATHNWGFLALALDRAMPNIVLDSRANNSLFGSNLPAVLDRKQILRLEGDFNEHFTLYCPQQYEQDALYIFTPDLMALLIDEASPYDVELVDQWMFVYSSRPFDMTEPAVLQRLFRIADTVGAKALSQTDHYADDRIGDPAINLVAPQGARLKRGISLLGVVLVAGFVALWGWTFASNFFR
ncbi:MAG: hypothetical protein ABJA11_02020 [Pseudolysinimonas sp.]